MPTNTGYDASQSQSVNVDLGPEGDISENAQVKLKKSNISGKNANILPNYQHKFDEPYAGMPADMVRYYSNQPFYRIFRYILLLGLLGITVLLATLASITIAKSADCLEDWQKAPIYQVYPISFKDSNNDGFGDLQGIRQKLDYITDLGVGSVWLNPIYKSPYADMGYDVSDYRQIDVRFGDMEDFQDLLDDMHKKGLKLIMDFVPNHTSNEHEWFIASEDPNHVDHEKYKDYYVWRDANLNSTCNALNSSYTYPNNWVSEFNGPAWEWSEKRGQYYLHQFLKEQPDLNLEKEYVVQELIDILDFWLQKGVDGFRVDAVQYSHEAQHFRDEYPKEEIAALLPEENNGVYCSGPESDKNDLYHDFTRVQPGMHDCIEALRGKLLEYSEEPGVDKIMVTEAYEFDSKQVARYYGTKSSKESSFPFNFWMLDFFAGNWGKTEANNDQDYNAQVLAQEVIEGWLAAPTLESDMYKDREWPNWVLGNHDNPRIVTRTNVVVAESLAVLMLSLPGTQTLYYGDEIGMVDVDVTESTDEGGINRDKARAPMQWDNSTWAGFTENVNGPWLPVDESTYHGIVSDINVEKQIEDETSMLNLYKKLIKLNKENDQLHRGHYCTFIPSDGDAKSNQFFSNNVLAYIREQNGLKTGFMTLINFNTVSKSLTLKASDFGHFTNLDDIIINQEGSQVKQISDNTYQVDLAPNGYLLAEYDISGEQYFERDGAVCYVARETKISGGVSYKV